MDPRTRLGLLASAGILAVTLEGWVALSILAFLCALPLFFLGTDPLWWRRGCLAVLAVIWSCLISQGLFYGEQPRVALFEIGPLTIWKEGLRYGLVQSLRLVALSLGGIALAVSTPRDRLFAALLRLRVPFGLALMAVAAVRFLPEVGRELLEVRRARRRRGRPAHHRNPVAWLLLEVSLLRPVVARSLRRAHSLAESLDARGFDPVAPRAVREPLVMARWEKALLLTCASLVLCVVSAQVLTLLYSAESFYFPSLRPVYGFVRTWL